jgi:hypothetical protein
VPRLNAATAWTCGNPAQPSISLTTTADQEFVVGHEAMAPMDEAATA